MRTDISKINEQSPCEDLTEGLMIFAQGTSKDFKTGEWRTSTPVFDRINANNAFCARRYVPTDAFPLRMEDAMILIWITARDAGYMRKPAPSARSR